MEGPGTPCLGQLLRRDQGGAGAAAGTGNGLGENCCAISVRKVATCPANSAVEVLINCKEIDQFA